MNNIGDTIQITNNYIHVESSTSIHADHTPSPHPSQQKKGKRITVFSQCSGEADSQIFYTKGKNL